MSIFGKPEAAKKFHNYHRKITRDKNLRGKLSRVLELAYNNACNFHCQHCSTRAPLNDGQASLMPFEKIASLADEAHELGIFEFNLHGGELIIKPEQVFSLLDAIKPERFYTFLTTNGYLMTQELAGRLAASGVDRVSVSLDSMNPETHDGFRGVKGAHRRALDALEYVKSAGMRPYMNITVGHFNAMSDDLDDMCRYSYERGYITFLNAAIPSGSWKGRFDVMLDKADKAHLIELRKKYKNIFRDLWDVFDSKYEKVLGCQTISKLYVTPSGDVLPCSFIHIKIGNVYEKSLREIVDYGLSIKYFNSYMNCCLAGECPEFARRYMMGDMSMQRPAPAGDVFEEEDFMQRW
ncbi:MAG: radical SAM protein [Synergistaceae bacterium]|jgi:MoaA/NifB/PqqE/SkfB family radical SAM enzyme|nr:radical SAM protein [Synergistaceae bacterium]